MVTTNESQVATGTGAFIVEGKVRVPCSVLKLDGFRRWVHSDNYPERGRFSFLAGDVEVDMSPEEIQTHNKCKSDLGIDVGLWVRRRDLGDLLSDGALFVNEQAGLSTEPDLMFVSWSSLQSGRVRYAELVEGSERYVEVVGSPDLVVEIVSNSSEAKDTKSLPPLYFAAGVAEYWLIDARREVSFQIKTRGPSDWNNVEPNSDGFHRSPVLGGSFRLIRQQNRVGGYRYELQSKSSPSE